MNISGKSLIEMLEIMRNRYVEAGESGNAAICQRLADGILIVFRSEGMQKLEIPGYEWINN